MEYLHIVEYSAMRPTRIPRLKFRQFRYKIGESVYHAYIDNSRVRIKEDFDKPLEEDSKISEDTISLDDVILVDDLDLDKESQKLAFVYECPVCLNKTITTASNYDFCPHCENSRFSPEVIGIINVPLMEDIAVNHPENTTFIQTKDGKVVFKDVSKKQKALEQQPQGAMTTAIQGSGYVS